MKLTHTLAVFAASSIAASAATTLTYDGTNDGTGSYGGQTFTASDSDFVTTGDALSNPFALQTIEIAKWSTSDYTTAQTAVYANIYDGNTFLGSSTNTVDFTVRVDGIIGDDADDAWLFSGVTALENLDSSKVYSIRYSTTDTAGDFTFLRPGLINDAAALTGGNLLDSSGNPASAGWDTRMVITTGPAVPEPSSAALLGLGGLALILRRRK
ncbi:PEP-CTERM sorting domain-containing protein [Verrucomicrobiaceae bacterium N1E253]|uniref:PEP-CTERM sorting domain-containing protein n=1 Tax=Oceaniferula marina TaxID=2748318 RepID=A0A851GHX1_9BACT|nr:PEP-CTERM sorting domain-containing protein [Oceaniferula marina]NWK56799.1 PEP-CTERM sorting domain-containing protein [Oceaniferula marina]